MSGIKNTQSGIVKDLRLLKEEFLNLKGASVLKSMSNHIVRAHLQNTKLLICIKYYFDNIDSEEAIKLFTTTNISKYSDYNKRIDGGVSSKIDFYKSPNKYQSSLSDYINHAQILIAGHFYAEGSPYIITNNDLLSSACKIQVIGDISCDIAGPIASTIRPSTISEPIYGYNPITSLEDDYTKNNIIAVMAVDNLPCSLPKDASIDFGDVFIKDILPDLIERGPIMSNASITLNGSLTDRFKYLSEYIN